MNEKKIDKRIEIIDGLRGLSVVLMVAYHFLYNLVVFINAPSWFFRNPVFTILAPFFAGLFIFLSGVSSCFSGSNIKRGIRVLALSVVVTAVTYYVIEMPIWFGILHFLGFSMVFYGLTYKLWGIIPRKIAPFLFIALTIIGVAVTDRFAIHSVIAWVLGLGPPGRAFLYSYDFFPIIPWLFIFLLGTWAGFYVKERKLPDWFYTVKIPIFPSIGRKALLIYIIHQPVLYGIVLLVLHIL